mgnify:CR=1 FL=1
MRRDLHAALSVPADARAERLLLQLQMASPFCSGDHDQQKAFLIGGRNGGENDFGGGRHRWDRPFDTEIQSQLILFN